MKMFESNSMIENRAVHLALDAIEDIRIDCAESPLVKDAINNIADFIHNKAREKGVV